MKSGLGEVGGFPPLEKAADGAGGEYQGDGGGLKLSLGITVRGLSSRTGFTLVELMVVALISVFVFIAFSSAIDINLSLIESAENSIVALTDATSVVENIRNVNPIDASSLSTAYPDGGFVPGYNNLNQETVQVNYENLAADPIKVTITVNWMEKARARSETLVTQLTQR